jgi:hypothetical protein
VYQDLHAGTGGSGIRRGGNGGSVSDFHAQFDIAFFSTAGGLINVLAGDGGRAVSGPGGAGGDLVNLTPFAGGTGSGGQNNFAGDLYMKAGDGGDGASGGRGGDIVSFLNRPSTTDNPGVLAFIAGNGGNGVNGNGGDGGRVANLNVGSTGSNNGSRPTSIVYLYNHIVAGAGGSSAGARGGNGGGVTNVITSASNGAYAVAAGAGGDGLMAGGNGGSVNTLSMAVAGLGAGKGLIIAGSGGSAGAFLTDDGSGAPAFGGRIGRGGNGGDILHFKQTGAIDAHFDFIAGNGGDSIHFGSLNNTLGKAFVGTGGSVNDVNVQGKIGNIDHDKPIVSYNDLRGGESMAEFVDSTIRASTDVANIADANGNVGIVVGGAGRLKSVFVGYDDNHQAVFRSIAAFDARNGDLMNVKAAAILAAVANSVEQIATISRVSQIIDVNDRTNTRGPLIGTNKDDVGVVEYGDPSSEDGKIQDPDFPTDPTKRIFRTAPVTDGFLIDGALVSRTAATVVIGGIVQDAGFAAGSHSFVIV